MRQKILIAAAVLHNPRIVMLDEPFSGLDVSAARVLKAFVRALADDGKIVVFSSHVLEVVEQVCSRVVILKDGHIVGHDSVANLRATLQLPSLDAVFAALVAEDDVDERTRRLVAAMNGLTDAAAAFAVSVAHFFARFFASESVTSDMQVRQTMIWVLAFLLTPGFILMVQLFPMFNRVRIIRACAFTHRRSSTTCSNGSASCSSSTRW